jgi:hypothetical protein
VDFLLPKFRPYTNTVDPPGLAIQHPKKLLALHPLCFVQIPGK